MSAEQIKTTEEVTLPVSATRFSAEMEVDQKNDNNKSAKIKILARTGDVLNHPWWGRVAHDFSTMKLHKPRITLDWNHEADHLVGYANHFDASSGDLIASGAITPTNNDPYANKIIEWNKAGIPLEASIDFSDEMEVWEYGEGEVVEVNGKLQSGPLTGIKNWYLRSIAVCPWGADRNTSSQLFARKDNKEVRVKITKFKNAQVEAISENKETEETEMSNEEKTVDVEATELASVAVEAEVVVEETAVETPAEEKIAEETVIEESVEEQTETTEEVVEESEGETLLSSKEEKTSERDVFREMVAKFGQELGVKYFTENLSIEAAEKEYHLAVIEENKQLRSQLETMKSQMHVVSEANVSVLSENIDSPMIAKHKQSGLSEGAASYAAKIKLPRAK